MPAPPRVCYRRPNNFRDLLVRAKLPPPAMQKNIRTKQGFRRCMNSRCQVCSFTVNTATHTSLHRKKTWNIHTAVDCNTSHCVYAVTCNKGGGPGAACSDCQYIGLTTRRAKVRWGEHKTSARPLIQSNSKPVGEHFLQKVYEVHDMKFVVTCQK